MPLIIMIYTDPYLRPSTRFAWSAFNHGTQTMRIIMICTNPYPRPSAKSAWSAFDH